MFIIRYACKSLNGQYHYYSINNRNISEELFRWILKLMI